MPQSNEIKNKFAPTQHFIPKISQIKMHLRSCIVWHYECYICQPLIVRLFRDIHMFHRPVAFEVSLNECLAAL